MKTRKKLLHSTLILALALGQTSGTVVEAVSMLSSVGSSTAEKVTKKKEEIEKTEKKIITTDSKTSEKKDIVISSRAIPIDKREEIIKTARIYLQETINQLLKNNKQMDKYNVGDQFILEKKLDGQIDFTKQSYYKPDFPVGGAFLENDTLSFIPPGKILPEDKESYILLSESGNWKLNLIFYHNSGSKWATDGKYSLIFTRLKIAPIQDEVFSMRVYYKPVEVSFEVPDFKFSLNFPTAEEVIGRITATAKTDENTLMQDAATPKVTDYITSVNNTRGTVKYEWKTAPDTSKVGKQNTIIKVSDETGRTTDVTVPITITPLPLQMTPKAGTHRIYQFDSLPNATDYFDVVNHYGTYRIEWVGNPNTYESGSQTWQAKAISSDNREVTSSVIIEVLPHPGMQVKLKPLGYRTLGGSYGSMSDSFKEYIEDVTMLGKSVDLNDLQFVVAESTEPDYQVVGEQNVKITVQAKHPVSNVMIKGTGTTTVNVLWGNTILMRSVDGHSAGAFALDVGNSNDAPAKLSIRQGIESPLNVSVGSAKEPFELYYNLQILRNGNAIYNQDVTNRATLQEVMDAFGDTNNEVTVQMNDIIQITHPSKTPNASVVMIKEKENDFTYGTEIARYRVTPYGFDPAPVMTAESAEKAFVLGEDVKQTNLNELVKNVRINGGVADNEFYTVEPLDEFDTSTIGKRNMRVKVTTKDKLASEIIEISYQVKWGDTFVIKGLKEATVGAFSLLKNQNQWQIQASQGVDGTNLNDPVDNYFGRDTYYSIEVLQGATSKFRYEVAGNQSIRESIQGFNNGQPLTVSKGDVIKVYHADPVGKNLLMKDELVKDYTIGSNYAYYEVTDHGLEPILAVAADSMAQEFILGEDSSNVDGAKLINSITINGTTVGNNQYTVKQMSDFDTSVAGSQTIKVRIDTKDGLVSKEIEVPYEVKWNDTILMKAQNGQSAGAFSLHSGASSTNRVLVLNQGLKTDLNAPISTDSSLYYSIEVLRDGRSVYLQEVPGRASLQQVMDNFGTKQTLNVQAGDVVKMYHPQRSEGSSVLMVDEMEEDYTYGSQYAYYRVTSYGFEPMSVIEAVGSNKAFSLKENTKTTDLSQLLAQVSINGEIVTSEDYTVEKLSGLDTATVGKKEVRLKLKTADETADIELDVPYEVVWGSTFLLKGLDDQNVGAYSIVEQDGEWTIQAGKGEDSTVLTNHVNNVFGRDTYYRIEVVANSENQPKEGSGVTIENIMGLDPTTRLSEQIKYQYDVTGNMTVGQAINGFNNGQPLSIEEGDIVKVYHAEAKNNLLMRDDLTKNYTAGSNYAYYQVANQEFEPITEMKAETVSQELTLGEDASDIDGMDLIKNVTFNGQKLDTTLYDVEQVSEFDTNTAGAKMLTVKLSTADGVTSTDVEVPYEVKWGSTIQLKNKKGETVGTFGLTKDKKQLKLQALQGKEGTNLASRVTEANDADVYYGIEVFTNNSSKYKYEVRGTQTIAQAIERFNSGEPLKVSAGDQIKVYHTDPSGNVLMAEETEQNYTYGSNYAYYNVTEYGFEPTGDFTVTPAEAKIIINTKQVDLKDLLKEVKVNGKEVPKNAYTVKLDPETEIDTSSLGNRVAKLVVKVDRSYGGFSTETEATYEVVKEGTPGALGESSGEGNTEEQTNAEGEGTEEANGGNLPKTNETKNAMFPLLGTALISLVGMFLLWKKKKTKEEPKK
ncbi:LPXTG cell wall anchor domain-containing protein [Enterococcus hirae]|uniref:LPXTG cell wall anchor domain-containing protein n=1 Tax=Enterococcus hirae TaxID=1354 RepID=UPI00391DDB02